MMGYQYFDEGYDEFLSHAEIRKEDMKFGLPDKKKYPMPDRKHVMSAIKFFNYVSPKDEETLARAILARMEEYGIEEVNVGPDNRFGKYYEKKSLTHHQIKGAKHGIRRWQNFDGTWTAAGRERYGKGGAPRGSYNDDKNLTAVHREDIKKQRDTAEEIKQYAYTSKGDVNEFDEIGKIPQVKKASESETIKSLADDYYNEFYKSIINNSDTAKVDEAYARYSKAVENEDTKIVGDYGNDKYDSIFTIKSAVKQAIDRNISSNSVKETSIHNYLDALENLENNHSTSNKERLQLAEDEMKKEFKLEKTQVKLEKTQNKREALEAKKESPKYQRDLDKKKQIEEKLNKLHTKTQKIRDNKIFKDKDPGLFDRMKLNKERRLEKQLSKINKNINKLDNSIDKLSKKEEKLKTKTDYKYDEKTREAMRIAREEGYKALTKAQKELLNEMYD